MAGVTVDSAAGFVSLLEEPADELKLYSLKALDTLVDLHWAEIADSLSTLREMYTADGFAHRREAYALASKVHYHLGDLDQAVECALGAGPLFDVALDNEYVNTLIRQCIDMYVKQRREQHEAEAAGAAAAEMDGRLEAIVAAMFDRCFRDGKYRQALGVALEARRMDMVRAAIERSGEVAEMLQYCFTLCRGVVKNLDFRTQVLRELVELHRAQEAPDHFHVCQILILLDDARAIADLLCQLLEASEDHTLLAYQVGFDLCDSCAQAFLARVREGISAGMREREEPDAARRTQYAQLLTILQGRLTVDLWLSFLSRHNRTDLAVLKAIKEAVAQRNLVCHNATVFANALMHAGTTKDGFLRDNLEWLQKATHWARFSATAGLGVIHKGHLQEGKRLLQPYLPAQTPARPYSEGGSLYGLGLIHANHGQSVVGYLSGELQNAKMHAASNPTASEVIQHGACLGLGLASMATSNAEVLESLMDVVCLENAVAGEAAGIAAGLVMLGTADQATLERMLHQAHVTQHEKIIRGLALGMALVMYGREEQADTLIEQLTRDKDALLRYGAMFTIGLAYCGTANNSAISRLLHVAVSDVSDNVRRAAVLNLGFLLSGQPTQCPKLVSLLAESYNPHVRYGATMAVGISCAGTGLPEALALLKPLAKDPVDFVRQGAMIAQAMVIIQTSQGENAEVSDIRQSFQDRVADKHEEVMAKFGAILASAIANSGGRNVTISLHSSSGIHRNMMTVVGLAVFCQYWYWYPLMHFVSLALTPICIIGLNKDLTMPVWKFTSNAPPSRFAYPPEVKPPTKEAPAKVSTAVLSTSRKAKARAQQRAAEKGLTASTAGEPEKEDADMEDAGKKEDAGNKEESPAADATPPEPASEPKENPARVTTRQRACITWDADSRWQPVKRDLYGIIMLSDRTPDEAVELVISNDSPTAAATPGEDGRVATIEDEPAPPEDFEFEE
mmetsp:Transcript_113/g.303  ORF Transcript_113/g.303 Transcript_113/m.303 type:complete len:963 (+) Transcript_113:86-2974(+)